MIRWTGLAPWEFEFPFPYSLICTFLLPHTQPHLAKGIVCINTLGTSLAKAQGWVFTGRRIEHMFGVGGVLRV